MFNTVKEIKAAFNAIPSKEQLLVLAADLQAMTALIKELQETKNGAASQEKLAMLEALTLSAEASVAGLSSEEGLSTQALQMDSVVAFALATGHMLRHDFSFVAVDEVGKQHSVSLDEMVWLHNHAEIIPELQEYSVFRLVDRAYLVRQKFKGEGKKIVATKHKVKFCDNSATAA